MRYLGVNNDNVILEVKNLSVAFGGRKVVEGLSYTLHRGETLGIVGESGSGKSVSSLAMIGLLPKQATVSGSALLDGKELLTLDENGFRNIRGRRISMVFQEPMTSLNPSQRCGEQVAEALMLHEHVTRKEARDKVLSLFEETRLPRPEKIYRSYPHEISGGQKQRVMIAMALICHPDVLIADEPTTALDVTVQKSILDLFGDLQRRYGIAIIFISHDLGVIAQVSHHIAVMYKGSVVEQGSADEVLRNPKHPYTRGLLACRPPLDSRPRRLPTVASFMEGEEAAESSAQHDEPQTNDIQSTITSVKAQADADVPLLRVRNLGVTYALKRSIMGKVKQQLKAVDGLSFDIWRGETLGLVGESGCGKSTLGRALLRLIDTSSGSVEYNGVRLDTLSRSAIRRFRPKLQIVFQDPYSSLNPRLTIGQAIMEPLQNYSRGANDGERRERVVSLMEQVGLKAEWFDRYPHEFSGGQRQRVCIARALILEPELVVCDESVSALDVSVQAQVLNLLNDLKERYGFTYLFITHDLSVVHYMADRIMVMRNGKIVESGTPDELFSNPQTDYTRTLLAAIPRI